MYASFNLFKNKPEVKVVVCEKTALPQNSYFTVACRIQLTFEKVELYMTPQNKLRERPQSQIQAFLHI